MNLKAIIKILVLMLVGICVGTTFSNAAIEIKAGTSPHVNISATTCFEYCYNMRAFSSSLGANSLDPHLTTNADWGAAAYLGLSGYGYVRSKTGETITIGSTNYYSTTNNATGVMNMGKIMTFTASNFDRDDNNVKKLYEKKDTKYVEILAQYNNGQGIYTNKKGLAIIETSGWFSSDAGYDQSSNKFNILLRK